MENKFRVEKHNNNPIPARPHAFKTGLVHVSEYQLNQLDNRSGYH